MVFCIKNYLVKFAPLMQGNSTCSRLGCRLLLIPFLLTLVFARTAQSEQIRFNKTPLENDLQLSYTWKDKSKERHQFSFTLPLSDIKTSHHKRFVPQQVTRYQYIAMQKERNNIDAKDARIEIKRIGQSLQIKVNSRSQQAAKKYQQQLLEAKDNAFEQYLSDNYYSHFSDYLGQQGIKPDHLRYISENQAVLKPFAQAMYLEASESGDMRAFLNLLLSWLQSIPYDDLENRLSSNGAGFSPPLALLSNNRGDCDSKSVLMASVIRALFPQIELVMLYLPNHALLGIAIPLVDDEQGLQIAGEPYVLMEPTGPALMSLNETASSSQRAIDTGMYSYEIIP
ncbi:hypothetical protein GPLA_0885 [Paraglaciecola polaris LMG 21857]|uniref:Transglutaminase-like domain-containing protein n=1 Tax=Paraglaciecola polaris LMG 21857 TaxID=1129793 RepID=K6Z6L5_9ALTE|nr:hypothetical protein GPLA_0885 [Paraglaciecola polaris LMG 21857]